MRNRPSWFLLALASLSLTLASQTSVATIYFVVGEHGTPLYGDSYILPLENPRDIAHARDLIVRGPAAAGSPIVVARIGRGADGINRDFLAPNEPLWSWHVTKLLDFRRWNNRDSRRHTVVG